MFDLDVLSVEIVQCFEMNVLVYDFGVLQMLICVLLVSIFKCLLVLIVLIYIDYFIVQFYRRGSFSFMIDDEWMEVLIGGVVFFDFFCFCMIEVDYVDNLVFVILFEFLQLLVVDWYVIYGLMFLLDSEVNVVLVMYLEDLW